LSTNWLLDVEPRPALLVLPDADSLDEAHAAIELWEHYSGKTLDLTQRLAVEVMMAERDGRWAAATTGREMPRQNGKGDEIEVVELWGLVQRGEAILHTVHDAVMLATQAQQRMLSVLERPDLRPRIKRRWLGTGQQMIEMKNGGVIWYRTRTGGGGRGVDDIDRLVVDEAQHATEEHLAAVSSTMFINQNSQLNAMGTSGLDGKSNWWWTIRKRALGPDPGRFGYLGHTAETVSLVDGRVVQEHVDVRDRAGWFASNPALHRRPDLLEELEEELLRIGDASFAREHLGVWDPPPDEGGSEIDMEAWVRLEADGSKPSPVCLGVEVSPDRKWTTIGLAGAVEDGRYIGVIKSGRGTGWVAEALGPLKQEWKPRGIALDPSGNAGSLVGELKAVKIEPVLVSGRDLSQATGLVLDGITEGTLRHSNQKLLNIAAGAAKTRTAGEAKVWDMRGETDIAPLKAVSIALWALGNAKPEKQRTGVAYL
jgi:hypothetical protein